MSLLQGRVSDAAFRRASMHINFNWLLRLRWILIAGQVFLIGLVHGWLKISLPIMPLFWLIVVAVISNVSLFFWQKKHPSIKEWMLGLLMIFDLVLLTGLFYLTGGPANPFSFLYLVYIAMGIMVLQAWWMWGVSLWTLLCYGFLFLRWDSSQHHAIHDPKAMQLHLEGMWLAYAITTVLIGYVVTRMKRALEEREKELVLLYDQQRRNEKLATLAALAGETVHEMATPLSTIAVVSKELERELAKGNPTSALIEDAQLIRQQVEYCHDRLQELVMHSGENVGEVNQKMYVSELFDVVLRSFSGAARVRRDLVEDVGNRSVSLPPKALRRVLCNLLDNAIEASQESQQVTLKAEIRDDHLYLLVIDQGSGIPDDLLPHVGEPFVTSKEEGQGHGLGVFLAKTLTERLGGSLHLYTESGNGTTVSMCFPL